MLRLEHRFVQYIPETLKLGIIYISMEYATAAHSCCCGCGEQVITPFSPTDWKLTYDGETVSLWPSIGNWNFPCRSHYIIRNSRILTAKPWVEAEIERGRDRDKQTKECYNDQKNKSEESAPAEPKKSTGLWGRLKKRVKRRRR